MKPNSQPLTRCSNAAVPPRSPDPGLTPPPTSDDIGYIHTILAQCFLPYRDPHTHHWKKMNGEYGIILTAGALNHPQHKHTIDLGLPYGAKPRLFQSYLCTQAMKQRSRVIRIAPTMSAMMRHLGLTPTGGENGNIQGFKNQIIRFAACHFTIIAPGKEGTEKYIKTPPIEIFEVSFPTTPTRTTIWPTEIQLTQHYYDNLIDHAIPYDFRGLRLIQNKPRAQDIYLWLTQRLCRLTKPLLLNWPALHNIFGGQCSLKEFKRLFPKDLLAAHPAYPEARIENHPFGFTFFPSPPPIRKRMVPVYNPVY